MAAKYGFHCTRLDATDGVFSASFLGEVAVPSHISPQAVFNYLVKNASFYDFQTLPLEAGPYEKTQHLLLGTDRILTQEINSDTRTYDVLRDNNEYDITFVVSPKESSEEGIVNMEYIVLMTSRRELFPKLTLDLHLRKKSPSSSSLSSMNGNRKTSLPDNGEVEPERGQYICFKCAFQQHSVFETTPSLFTLLSSLASCKPWHLPVAFSALDDNCRFCRA